MASVKAVGLDDLQSDLLAAAVGAGDLAATFGQIATESANIARSAAPRQTGRLAGSIRGSTTENRATVVATAVYAGAINYGWPKRSIRAVHFMQAVDRVMDSKASTLVAVGIDQLLQQNRL